MARARVSVLLLLADGDVTLFYAQPMSNPLQRHSLNR